MDTPFPTACLHMTERTKQLQGRVHLLTWLRQFVVYSRQRIFTETDESHVINALVGARLDCKRLSKSGKPLSRLRYQTVGLSKQRWQPLGSQLSAHERRFARLPRLQNGRHKSRNADDGGCEYNFQPG